MDEISDITVYTGRDGDLEEDVAALTKLRPSAQQQDAAVPDSHRGIPAAGNHWAWEHTPAYQPLVASRALSFLVGRHAPQLPVEESQHQQERG